MEAAETTFWQQFVLNSIGPLITVVIGSLLVGYFAARITRSAQDRRAEVQLRRDLTTETAEIVSKMWYEYSYFTSRRDEIENEDEVAELRRVFVASLQETRVRAEVARHRLNAYYASPDVADGFRAAIRELDLLREIALDKFLSTDSNREYWIRWESDIVQGVETGETPKIDRIEAQFRERATAYLNLILTSPLRPLA